MRFGIAEAGRKSAMMGAVSTFQEALVIASQVECIVVAPKNFVSNGRQL